MILYIIPTCTADYINYDSAYQYFLVQHNMNEIWSLLAEDYSPPLYTLILKLSVFLSENSLTAMRMTSMIYIIGMIFLGLFPIKNVFGQKTSVICTAVFMLSGLNFVFIPEIRPTVAAYFFVTAAAVYMYSAYFYEKRYAYICATVFSILAMYTHNVGMLSALAFYIVVLIFSAASKNLRKLKSFFISGVVCAVCYIPWLTVVFRQFANVRNNYWQNSEHTLSDIFNWSVNSVISIYKDSLPAVFMRIFIVIAVVLIIKKLFKVRKSVTSGKLFEYETPSLKVNKEKYLRAGMLLALFIAPIIVFEAFCLFVYPIVVPRYFYIFSGIAAIIIGVIISEADSKALLCVISVTAAVNLGMSIYSINSELKESSFDEMVTEIYNESGNTPAFVHSHEWSLGIMMYYFPNADHYITDDTWCVLNTYDVFPGEVMHIRDFYSINEYENEVYVFEGVFPDTDYDLVELYGSSDDYTVNHIGFFTEPYSYRKQWRLYKINTCRS